MPVPLETFISYGLAFQERLVPHLDARRVTKIERTADGFHLQVEDGESFQARRVIVAVGISHFAYVPGLLSHLPKDLLTHSSEHRDCSALRDKKVTIIGAGASAVDIAALMHESGVDVTLVARASKIRFHDGPGTGRRSLWQRLRNPSSGLGPGWKSRIYTEVPGMFRHLPVNVRLRIVKNHLGPAPGWPMKARVQGKIPMLLGYSIAQAVALNGGVRLSLRAEDGSFHEHETDHVIAATGYKPDLASPGVSGRGDPKRDSVPDQFTHFVSRLSVVCAWLIFCWHCGGERFWADDAICIRLGLHGSPRCETSGKNNCGQD